MRRENYAHEVDLANPDNLNMLGYRLTLSDPHFVHWEPRDREAGRALKQDMITPQSTGL